MAQHAALFLIFFGGLGTRVGFPIAFFFTRSFELFPASRLFICYEAARNKVYCCCQWLWEHYANFDAENKKAVLVLNDFLKVGEHPVANLVD